MIDVGEDPARLRAFHWLQGQGVAPIYGPLYLENATRALQSGGSLDEPYGDDAVWRRLAELQEEVPRYPIPTRGPCGARVREPLRGRRPLPSRKGDPEERFWLGGDFARGFLTPRSVLEFCSPQAGGVEIAGGETLRDVYLRVLRERGVRLSPRPRVIGLPGPGGTAASWDPVVVAFEAMAADMQTPAPYRELARAVAQGPPDWLKVPPEQPPARLFFSLARFLGDHPEQPGAFLEWCQERRATLSQLLAIRGYQTHPVSRCAYLLAGLMWLAGEFPARPFSVLDVGAAAGLHLNLAHYHIPALGWGDAESSVHIELSVKGAFRCRPIELAGAAGVDLHPLSASNKDDCRWLLAQTWGRRSCRLLKAALKLARRHPPLVHSGDAAEFMAGWLEEPSPDAVRVVFHSHLCNQIDREPLFEMLAGSGAVHLGLEWEDALFPILRCHPTRVHPGRRLAACPRGELHWL